MSKKIVLGVTGSIAAYKSADILRRLVENKFNVSVVMTTEAEHFITALTLSNLGAEAVYQNMFDLYVGEASMPHIKLAQEAHAIIVAPATANIIGKIACGLADDLLTCLILATKAPIILVPAMNNGMYNNAIFQENCRKLKIHGFQFIDPVKGTLACGNCAEGHIADTEDIIKAVVKKIP